MRIDNWQPQAEVTMHVVDSTTSTAKRLLQIVVFETVSIA